MNLVYAAVLFLLAFLLALAGVTRVASWLIERRNPPVGSFIDIDGAMMHYVHVPAPENAELPPIVFIHGASANFNDQMPPLRPPLEGRAGLLFLDRPGHGWSERGQGNNETQAGQAATIAVLMDRLGIGQAIIVGHSFGGSVAAAFALDHPEKTRGLVFLSAATHPWPGGATSWDIEAPTVAISGDADTVVYEEIHSLGLARDIPGAELVWVRNLGHKPDWIAPDLVVAAIETLGGKRRDLQALARTVEARIAGDTFGAGGCINEKAPTALDRKVESGFRDIPIPDRSAGSSFARPNERMAI